MTQSFLSSLQFVQGGVTSDTSQRTFRALQYRQARRARFLGSAVDSPGIFGIVAFVEGPPELGNGSVVPASALGFRYPTERLPVMVVSFIRDSSPGR